MYSNADRLKVEQGETFFQLPKTVRKVLDVPDVDRSSGRTDDEGFWYPMRLEGKVVPSSADIASATLNDADVTTNARDGTTTSLPSAAASQRLIAATHLCAFLRHLILRKTGLSSSGGVAECKMVAKMMVGVGKPAGQAVWFDGREAEDVEKEGQIGQGALQAFLDPQPVRNIQGYGSSILATLRTAYPTLTEAPTIHEIRTTIPQPAFRRLFPSQGPALWGLLYGIDPLPVKPSPRYPAQISVEDSYAATLWRTWTVIREQALVLMEKLLQRMEEELTSGDGYSRGIRFHPPLMRDVKWVRYPSQIRFNIRTFTSTQSKSVAIPAFVFDTSTARRDRSEKTMKVLGDRVLQSLLGKRKDGAEGGGEYEVYV
jgi:DNA polymerase iota